MKATSFPDDIAREARRLVRPVRQEILTLAQELVRTDSVAIPPDGHEAPSQKVLARRLKRCGLDVELYDTVFLYKSGHPWVRHERHYAGRPNLIARLNGRGGGRSLLLSGHIDTVPPNGTWKRPPFSGEIRAGRLHGRGSFDMKGGLAAHFGVAMALRRAGLRLAGDLLCESVIDEEWAGAGGTLAGRLRGDRADACVITEGTNLAVLRATRGGHFFEIEVAAGDPAKYFSNAEVVSPAVPLGRLLGWIDEWTARRRKVQPGPVYRDFPDPAPVQVIGLEANRLEAGVPWSVPLAGRVRVYFQFLPHEDVPAVIRQIYRSLDAFRRKDPFFRAYPPKVVPLVAPPLYGHELAADHPWTRCLAGGAAAVLGKPATISAAPYPCDAFLIQREFGVPTLLFGPCGAGAHNVDEYATTRFILQTTEALLAAALAWCGSRK